MFVLGSYDHFPLSVSPFSPSCVTKSSSKPTGVRRVNRWTKNVDQRREDHYYEALAFSWHNIDLVFGVANMTLENAGIDPSTMRVSKWYKESTRKDVDPHPASSISRERSCYRNKQVIIPGTRAY